MLKRYLPFVILIFCSLSVTVWYFQPVAGDLNKVLFSGSGDGIKNYFTYLFYISYDSGTHFSGMNYPFGENVVFTDNTPLLAWSVKWLGRIFPSVPGYALSIMHISLLLSVTFCSVFIFKILRHFNVSAWFAVPAALFISFFSPQILKFGGHFGMAYLVFFPMQIYWLMKYDRRQSRKYPVFIAAAAVFFSFLHVYHLAFTAVLSGFYILAGLIVYRKKGLKTNLLNALPLFISLIISFACFALYLKITDPVGDRPSYPYGVFGAATTGADIFLSRLAPLGFTFQFLFGKAEEPAEGYVYIGIISVAVALFLIYRVIRSAVLMKFSGRKTPAHPVRDFRLWLWVAFFHLLFGMGVPFVWNADFFADYIAAFRQFRTIGRFSWGFYYLILIFTAVFIFRLYRRLMKANRQWQAKTIAGVVLAAWAVQLSGYAKHFRNGIAAHGKEAYDNYFSGDGTGWNQWLLENGYQKEDFQAAIGLPFFHIGSEKLWLQDNDNDRTFYFCSQIAMQTGIPMTDVLMSRTSWHQTFENVRLADGPFTPKPVLDLFSDKAVLILVNKNFPLEPKEEEWIQNGAFIGERNNLELYSVNLKNLVAFEKDLRDSIAAIAFEKTAQEGLIGKEPDFFFTRHFEDRPSEISFSGTGAFNPAKKEAQQLIAAIRIQELREPERDYIFSVWTKCHDRDYRTPYFILKQYNDADDLLTEEFVLPKYSTRAEEFWLLSEKTVRLKPETRRLEFFVVSSDLEKSYIALDDLAFWPSDAIYFYKDGKKLFINNRPQ